MEHITLPSAKALNLPFCSAARAGDFLFLSGAIGNRPGTMTLVEGGLSSQARQAMENIGEVLGPAGSDSPILSSSPSCSPTCGGGPSSTPSISVTSTRTGSRRARPSARAGSRSAAKSKSNASPTGQRPPQLDAHHRDQPSIEAPVRAERKWVSERWRRQRRRAPEAALHCIARLRPFRLRRPLSGRNGIRRTQAQRTRRASSPRSTVPALASCWPRRR